MNVTLRQLRAFTEIADAQSFTKAAKRLHVTQSALSVLMRELEQELGVRVLDRDTHNVRLSEAGRDLYPLVRHVLASLEDAVTSVTTLRDKKRGVLRVGAPHMMAFTLIPDVIATYSALFPDVEVFLADTSVGHMLAPLSTGEVELVVGPDVSAHEDIAQQLLMRQRHQLVCRPDDSFARARKVRWSDLREATFIVHDRAFMNRLLPSLAASSGAPMEFTAIKEVAYLTTAIGMVRAGLGVTICAPYAAPLVQAYGLVVRPLIEPASYREIFVYRSAKKSLSPAAEAFIDVISTYVREHGVA
jgi:DNA-binding transcriptional LysR family regulator